MDYGRVWTVINQLTDEDTEHGHLWRYVGWFVDGASGIEIRNRIESDARDIILLANTRVVVANLLPSKKLGLRAAFKAVRGDLSGVAPHREWPRSEFVSLTLGHSSPDGTSIVGEMSYAQLTMAGGFTRTLMLDPGVNQPGTEEADGYAAGANR